MIFLLYGEDIFRRKLAVSKYKAEFVQPDFEAMNWVQLEQPSISEMSAAICMPSFGLGVSGARVVLVQDFAGFENKSEDDEVKAIVEALENVPAGTIVIFSNSKILKTLKIHKKISKLKQDNGKALVEYHEFKNFSPWETEQAASWLMDVKSKADADIDRMTANYLVEYIGSEDSSTLYTEIKRLGLLAAGPITQELIEKECKPKHDVFRLARELASAQQDASVQELRKLIKSGELHLGALAALQTTISRYLKLKLMDESARPEFKGKEAQAKVLGITPGRLYYLKQEVSRMRSAQLEQVNNKLAEIERKIKTGQGELARELRLLTLQK